LLRLIQLGGRQVQRVDGGGVAGQRRQVRGLAAQAGAGVQDALAGRGAAQLGDDLRPHVLDRERAVREGGGGGGRVQAARQQRVGRDGRRGQRGAGALGGQRLLQRRAGHVPQAVRAQRQRRDLAGRRAQRDGARGAQLAQAQVGHPGGEAAGVQQECARVAGGVGQGRFAPLGHAAQERVRQAAQARAVLALHRLDGVVDGGVRGDAIQKQQLVGAHAQHVPDVVRDRQAAGRHGVQRAIQAGAAAEHAVDQLGGQAPLGRCQLRRALQRRGQGAVREGAVVGHARQHLAGQRAPGAWRLGGSGTWLASRRRRS
jgi:hypothetical protein